MLDNPVANKYELIQYAPSYQQSADLEPATKTISATSQPASADYSTSLALTASPDARMIVLRVGVRVQVTIDSWAGGGTTLNCVIKQGANTIATTNFTTTNQTGALYAGGDATVGALTGAQTYSVYLWVDQGSCVISVCIIQSAVGSVNPGANGKGVLQFSHTGMLMIGLATRTNLTGGGTYSVNVSVVQTPTDVDSILGDFGGAIGIGTNNNAGIFLSPGNLYLNYNTASVATALLVMSSINLILMS